MKPGGLDETRDPQQASVIPPLAVRSDLSETNEASAPSPAAEGMAKAYQLEGGGTEKSALDAMQENLGFFL